MIEVSQARIDELLQPFVSQDSSHPFEILSGKGNVIVSAPHSVEQTRHGRLKAAERQSGVLCRLLHEFTSCPVIYKLRNEQDDANYDENCYYKEALTEFIQGSKVGCLIDLHQMAPFRDEMIDVGTGKGINIFSRNDILALIVNSFQALPLSNVVIDWHFNAAYPHTVSSTIARTCQIPCFQVEINSRLLYDRFPDYNFNGILTTLTSIINTLNEG